MFRPETVLKSTPYGAAKRERAGVKIRRQESGANRSVYSLGFCDPFIDGLASGEAFLKPVPVSDRLFPKLPAEQDGPPFDLAGKIEQPYAEIFDLHTNRVDFGEGILGPLLGLGAFRFASRERDDVEERSSVEEYPVLQSLLLGVGLIHDFLGLDGGSQQRFQYR